MIFKNKNFKKRDYECTNVVYAITDGDETPNIKGEWEPVNFVSEQNVKQLWVEGNSTIFGYL